MSTFALAMQLLRLWLLGYSQIPGYTVAERDHNGDIYIAAWLRPPEDTGHGGPR